MMHLLHLVSRGSAWYFALRCWAQDRGTHTAAPHLCLFKRHLLTLTSPCLRLVFHPLHLLSRLLILLSFSCRIRGYLYFPLCLLSEAQTWASSTLLLNWKLYLLFHAIIRLTVWIEDIYLFSIFITWHFFFFFFYIFPVFLLFLLEAECLFVHQPQWHIFIHHLSFVLFVRLLRW